MRIDIDQAVETLCKAVDIFSGQSYNQISVHMGVSMLSQPADIFFRFFIILFSADQVLYIGIERLNSDFQLQGTFGKLQNGFFQRVG